MRHGNTVGAAEAGSQCLTHHSFRDSKLPVPPSRSLGEVGSPGWLTGLSLTVEECGGERGRARLWEREREVDSAQESRARLVIDRAGTQLLITHSL